jgi:NADH-quinone oxidoreductase subunit L
MLGPMILLAGLSVVGGAIDLPPALGNVPMLSNLLHDVLPARETTLAAGSTLRLQCLAGAVSVIGAAVGLWLYWAGGNLPARLSGGLGGVLRRWWLAGWGFDWLYRRLFVQPVLAIADANRNDFFDTFFESLGAACTRLWELLRQTQNGRLRWYAATLALGAAILLAMAVIR